MISSGRIGFVVRSVPLGGSLMETVRTAPRIVSIVLVERIVQRWFHFLINIDLLTVFSQAKPAINWVPSKPGNLGILLIR